MQRYVLNKKTKEYGVCDMTDDQLNQHACFGKGKWIDIGMPPTRYKYPKYNVKIGRWEDKDTRSHVEKRKYPELGEQFDALFRAMEKGEIQKAPEFYNMLDKVKKDNPKDGVVKGIFEKVKKVFK